MNASNSKAYTIPGVDSMSAPIASPLHLPPLEDKAIFVDFDGGRLSSDGGLILLNDPDYQIGLTRDLAAVLRDPRDPRRVNFTTHDLLKQRVLQIAVGYEDANDANTLRHDPIFKLLLGRLPESGPPLASQPTISRFENRVSRTDLYRLARVLVDQFIASYERPPKLIVLDFDDTEDPAHGQQEQVRYDGYYGGYCFLPLHVYEGLSGRLITTLLKAKRFSAAQLLAVLKRLVKHLRQAWPETLIVFRGDSHFAYPEVMEWIEAQAHLSYVTGLTGNAVLKTLAHAVGEQAKRAYERDGGKVTRFHSARYRAGTWSRPRRVVIKVEVSGQGVNTRFVVTDLERAGAKGLYRQLYCARGQMENEIKDHKRYLKSDRTSCHRFTIMQSTVHSCYLGPDLVATAAVARAQPLPSLDEPWPGGTRRFTLAQASGTTEASSTAPPDEDNPAELAKKLQNPVADLISVLLQNNWDFGIGPAEAMRYTV